MGLHSLLCPFSPKWKIRLKKKPGRGINGTDRPTVGGPSRPPTLQKASPRPLNLIRFASVMRRKRINKFDRWMLLLHLIFNTWHGRSPGRSPFCENNLHLWEQPPYVRTTPFCLNNPFCETNLCVACRDCIRLLCSWIDGVCIYWWTWKSFVCYRWMIKLSLSNLFLQFYWPLETRSALVVVRTHNMSSLGLCNRAWLTVVLVLVYAWLISFVFFLDLSIQYFADIGQIN